MLYKSFKNIQSRQLAKQTFKKCSKASSTVAAGGVANSVAAILRSTHESI